MSPSLTLHAPFPVIESYLKLTLYGFKNVVLVILFFWCRGGKWKRNDRSRQTMMGENWNWKKKLLLELAQATKSKKTIFAALWKTLGDMFDISYLAFWYPRRSAKIHVDDAQTASQQHLFLSKVAWNDSDYTPGFELRLVYVTGVWRGRVAVIPRGEFAHRETSVRGFLHVNLDDRSQEATIPDEYKPSAAIQGVWERLSCS